MFFVGRPPTNYLLAEAAVVGLLKKQASSTIFINLLAYLELRSFIREVRCSEGQHHERVFYPDLLPINNTITNGYIQI